MNVVNKEWLNIKNLDKNKKVNKIKKGCRGRFLSDIKKSQKYKNVENLKDILDFYKKLLEKYSI